VLTTQAHERWRVGGQQAGENPALPGDDDEVDEIRGNVFAGVQNVFEQSEFRTPGNARVIGTDARTLFLHLVAGQAVSGK
jgi:hypothetical protein